MGEGDDRWWDGWMVSPTPLTWTWVWVSSGSWWRTGRPGVLQSMALQRVGHDWVTTESSGIFLYRSHYALFSFIFLSIWACFLIVVLMSLCTNYLFHCSGVSIDWFFSVMDIPLYFVMCLVIFDWMILSFLFLHVGLFSIKHLNHLKICLTLLKLFLSSSGERVQG